MFFLSPPVYSFPAEPLVYNCSLAFPLQETTQTLHSLAIYSDIKRDILLDDDSRVVAVSKKNNKTKQKHHPVRVA